MAEAETETETEKEGQQVIARIGKQLDAHKTCPRKDILVKLLKQAANAFPFLKQSKSSKLTVRPLSGSLIRLGLLHHKDRDVILLVGECICEILRVLAPEHGYTDAVLKDIFKLLLSLFRELDVDDVASPYFTRSAKSLEIVAKLQFCEVIVGGCEDSVLKMFKSFFSITRDEHPKSVIDSMVSIIKCILVGKMKEANSDMLCTRGNTLQQFMDVVLQNIIKEGTPSASYRLAELTIRNCGAELDHCICQFLTSCILNRDAIRSIVKEAYHEIILEVFKITPQMLLSVIPHLSHELLTDQVDVRIKALSLIRKLLLLRWQYGLPEYRHVFVELLNRFSDKSADVRLAALYCAKALCMTNPSGRESLEVLSAVQGRLLDHDDKVRAEAVNSVCELAKNNLKFASSDLICQAAERLRDKKVSVRSKALKSLVELYQEYCSKCATDITLVNDHIEEIPCKVLMLCYERDCQELRPQAVELVLANLFPASLPIEESTRHWIFMLSLFKPPHLRALKTILSLKRRLQDGLQDFLELLNKPEENGSEEAERQMEALVVKMSSCFPDPFKAKDCFLKCNELKARGIFNVLQQLLREEITPVSENNKDIYLKELGDQSTLLEFFHVLAAKCSFNIFSSKHVRYILDHLCNGGAENKHPIDHWIQLLLLIICAFPSLLRGSEKQLKLLLVEREIPFSEQLMEMLARDGHRMSIKLGDVYASLEKICLEGTRMQAKLAVSAIAALADASEQFIFLELCQTLVDSLCSGQNVPAILQSIGCLAQHSMSTFEAQEKLIKHYIVEDIFKKNDVIDSLADETSKCCSSCQYKVFGLKALVRSFLPHKQTLVSHPIGWLLDIIRQMLEEGISPDSNIACEHDKAYIRLASAKSVLRLSRRWDLHISPQIFRLTILVAKDQSPFIRRSFSSKLHRLLKKYTVPIRYACGFSFFALDSQRDLRSEALKYLGEFIQEYSKGAQIHENMAMHGAADHPVYLIVFLIHVLAHDINFPSLDCQDTNIYAQFLSPLFFTLQELVNNNFVDGKIDVISNASSYLRSIFNAIKRAEDAIDAEMTPKLHFLAEVGISILNSLNATHKHVLHTPGIILLPSSLYRSVPAGPKLGDGKADATFIKKLVFSLKIETGTMGNVSGQQLHENPRLSGTRINRPNSKYGNTSNLLINETNEPIYKFHIGRREECETSYQQANAGGRQKDLISSGRDSVTLCNDFSVEHIHGRDGRKKLESRPLSSCVSVTAASLLSDNKVVASSEEENTIRGCGESSLLISADLMNPCGSKIIRGSGEALISKPVKLGSPTERCYYSGVIDNYNSDDTTHQITFDCGEVDILSVDREKWEIDLDSLQKSQDCNSSASGQSKIADAFEYDAKLENVTKNKDLCGRKFFQAAKRNKRRYHATDTSTSDITNVARRTRRHKV